MTVAREESMSFRIKVKTNEKKNYNNAADRSRTQDLYPQNDLFLSCHADRARKAGLAVHQEQPGGRRSPSSRVCRGNIFESLYYFTGLSWAERALRSAARRGVARRGAERNWRTAPTHGDMPRCHAGALVTEGEVGSKHVTSTTDETSQAKIIIIIVSPCESELSFIL